MASKPSYQDYGIPDSLAVPSGEPIQGWSDTKASCLSRIILYNQHVIYSIQQETLRRLDRLEKTITPTTDIHDLPTRGNDSPAAAGSNPVLPKTAPGIPIKHYLESAGTAAEPAIFSSRPTDDQPPLIRRFVMRNESTKVFSSDDHVPTSLPARKSTSPASIGDLAYNTLSHTSTSTMAPSDQVTSDLAGLVFDSPAPAVETSSPTPLAAAENGEQVVGLSVPDVLLWARLHKYGDNDDDNASTSPTESTKQEHLDLLYLTTESEDRAANLPIMQPAQEAASSKLPRAGSTEKSISIRASSTIMAPDYGMPRMYHISKATATNTSQPRVKHQPGAPDWMNKTVSEAMREQQKGRLILPRGVPILLAGKGKEKERDDINYSHHASDTPPAPTPVKYQDWSAQVENKLVEQPMKAKEKEEEFSFW